MTQMIFVNLPVQDLERATSFYRSLGYGQNMQFSDDKASCITISDAIVVMLLTEPFFATFTPGRTVADATAQTEAILALSAESKEAVDLLVEKAIAAGGRETRAAQDEGFMYSRAFEDLDGHLWETIYMEPSHVEQAPAAS